MNIPALINKNKKQNRSTFMEVVSLLKTVTIMHWNENGNEYLFYKWAQNT